MAPPQETRDRPYYLLTAEETVRNLSTDRNYGLSVEEFQSRLAQYGENTLGMDTGVSIVKVFLSNLFNPMNFVLSLALLLSCLVQDWIQAIVLAVIIATNTAIGFAQEYNSENTMAALKKLSAPSAKVVRSGQLETVSSRHLVRGDIIIIEEGDQLPADIRLFEAVNLEIDEMLLTGESMPVRKTVNALEAQADVSIPVGDRINLGFSSTTVTRGRGKGVVFATGLNTEIGRIANFLRGDASESEETPASGWKAKAKGCLTWGILGHIFGPGGLNIFGKSTKTPLQKSLDRMMFLLLGICFVLAVFVFWSNHWNLEPNVLLYAVAVAVAIIPEGLPAVVTVTMAVGVRSMAKQKAVVRRLVSLEAIGMVTNICSDKTGTLTEGKMTAKECWLPNRNLIVDGTAIDPTNGGVSLYGKKKLTEGAITEDVGLRELFSCAAFCNEASLFPPQDPNSTDVSKTVWTAIGDPTEIALQVLAHRVNMGKEALLKKFGAKFVQEMPFDPTLKRMTVVNAISTGEGHKLLFHMKGALERVLECSVGYQNDNGNVLPLDEAFHTKAHEAMEALAEKGLRVLAVAYRTEVAESVPVYGLDQRTSVEKDMIFVGLVGIYDPPRENSAPAVRLCKQAGITVHMATGDHGKTATAIAKMIGILKPGDENLVYTAAVFDRLSDAEIDALPQLPLVLARCSPETKVKLVAALHRRGKYVAMTGDGTNDAPALKAADVGVAMGLTGSDVAKEASEIVLTDDNFSTIVSAVREGRRIFANICKFSLNFLSGNVSEVIAMVAGLAIRGFDDRAYYPMSAIQVLWLNMITSSPICLCLAREKASRDIMRQQPRGAGHSSQANRHRLNRTGTGMSVDSGLPRSNQALAGGDASDDGSAQQGSTSIFTGRFLVDVFFYGALAGILSLASFMISLAVTPRGLNGYDATVCNSHSFYDEDNCKEVYQARGVAFMVLNTILLVHGWNCRHELDSTLFGPESHPRNNWPLVGAIIGGFLLTLLTLVIPVFNTTVFQHDVFGWQWGLVGASVVIFLAGSELYKLAKRNYLRRKAKSGQPQTEDINMEAEGL